jgi:HlyD family secretion protein
MILTHLRTYIQSSLCGRAGKKISPQSSQRSLRSFYEKFSVFSVFSVVKFCLCSGYVYLFALVFFLAGCGSRGVELTPTMVPTPIVEQKPTYTVQRGEVAKSLKLVGRVSPVEQQELFFHRDGYVKAVYFKRGDTVKTGDVLAELETGDLALQLAQAELALQVAEGRLAQAQQDNVDQLIQAQLSLDRANLQALQAGAIGVTPSVSEAEANVAQAQAKFDQAKQANTDAQANPDLTEKQKKDFQAAYNEASRQLDNAKALLAAETSLIAAQGAMDTARQNYETAQTSTIVTDAEKTAASDAFEQAKLDFLNAWEEYARALGGKYPLGFTARLAGMDAALARLEVDKLQRGVDPLLALEVDQARLNLQSIQANTGKAQLVAPFDGQILSIGVVPGSQVTAFQNILTLAAPQSLEITAIPSPDELVDLGVGMTVTVRLSTQPDKEYTAKVKALPILSSSASGGEASSNDPAMHITLDDPSVALTLGETATLVIQVEARPDVLWLPPAALRTYQGQDFVFIETNGVQRRVNVVVGLQSSDRVEILEGLEEGQTVVGP